MRQISIIFFLNLDFCVNNVKLLMSICSSCSMLRLLTCRSNFVILLMFSTTDECLNKIYEIKNLHFSFKDIINTIYNFNFFAYNIVFIKKVKCTKFSLCWLLFLISYNWNETNKNQQINFFIEISITIIINGIIDFFFPIYLCILNMYTYLHRKPTFTTSFFIYCAFKYYIILVL